MQELVTVTSCDVHFAEDNESHAGEEVTWYVGKEPWVVDLCEALRLKTTLYDMDRIVRSYGRPLSERRGSASPPKRRRRKKNQPRDLAGGAAGVEPFKVTYTPEGRVECPWPGCGRDYKNFPSMSGHFRVDHGVRLTNWVAEKQGVKPEYFCSCGEGFITRRALSSHVSTNKTGEEHVAVAVNR